MTGLGVKPEIHDAICLIDFSVFTLGHYVNRKTIRYESISFNRIMADKSLRVKGRFTRCEL